MTVCDFQSKVIKNTAVSILPSWISCSGGASHHAVKALTLWHGPRDKDVRPPTNSPVNELSLEANSPAPVTCLDDCNLIRDP